ncbi:MULTISPECIES: CDGSH iron-sulfur domain-containing protein [Streptomyces]|uniref:(Fe-S) protein n=1 Tax=Streptomyces violaceoruber TaxID=1935 RepID=A0A1V0U5B4_STRVN|nr:MULTISPECIES: CDGSH iron-sulfur domain-containing protein [Streptomyces]ARF60383.1 (Fe-S) protein [Streptomyces violaceoruber]
MVLNREGPVLVEGPVEVVGDDGTTARSDRFLVAICTCRRSRAYPWCDTSHRRRKPAEPRESRPDGRSHQNQNQNQNHDQDQEGEEA